MKIHQEIIELTGRFQNLQSLEGEIQRASETLLHCFRSGGKLLICGNGGSSSDSDHIVGEMMKGFEHKRKIFENIKSELIAAGGDRGWYLSDKLQMALPAISLSAHTGLITAVANDTDGSLIYAQQVMGYGNSGDILMAISTSGNSQNVIDAIITAKARKLIVIGMTGETGGKMRSLCDIILNVPAVNTAMVQELHLPVYHTLCKIVESEMFNI